MTRATVVGALWLILPTIDTLANESMMTVVEFFQKARYENMAEMCEIFYSKDVEFSDPVGDIKGRDALIRYYKHMYENVISIDFKPIDEIKRGQDIVFIWQMDLKHKRVRGGESVIVDGVSVLRYRDGMVSYHRDYFDLGAMLYENIPVIGSIIRWIKRKAHG